MASSHMHADRFAPSRALGRNTVSQSVVTDNEPATHASKPAAPRHILPAVSSDSKRLKVELYDVGTATSKVFHNYRGCCAPLPDAKSITSLSHTPALFF